MPANTKKQYPLTISSKRTETRAISWNEKGKRKKKKKKKTEIEETNMSHQIAIMRQ